MAITAAGCLSASAHMGQLGVPFSEGFQLPTNRLSMTHDHRTVIAQLP
jgi:hypothetical protein